MLKTSAGKLWRPEVGGGGSGGGNRRTAVDVEEDGMPLVETTATGGNGAVCRAGSCTEDPQASAMEALKAGNLRLLADILSEIGHQLEVNLEYEAENYKTLLQVGVEQGDRAAVEVLLRGGADPARLNSVLKTTAVHVAASQAKPDILALFIERSGPRCVDIPDRAGRSALHLAVIAARRHKQAALDCLRLCVSAGGNVNAKDRKGGQTPLYLAAASKQWECVKYLMENGADSSIPCQGMSTRQLIMDNFPADLVAQLDLAASTDTYTDNRSLLIELIDAAEVDGPDEDNFRAVLRKATRTELDDSSGEKTLVQMCAERGLDSYLRMLLRQGANPNSSTHRRRASGMLLAAEAGHAHVIQVFLEHCHQELKGDTMADLLQAVDNNGMTALHNILRQPRHTLNRDEDAKVDYAGCLALLMNCSNTAALATIINRQDLLGNTPLHYAVQFWSQAIVTQLLLIGANIGLKNLLGEAPIAHILPETMEEFLNNHCLSASGNPTNDDFRITFKYDFLAPPPDRLPLELQAEPSVNKLESDGIKFIHNTPMPETEVLWYMAGSKDHRHLLKHPVITSFLCLKWSKLSGHYNSNLIFYFILVSFLTAYIFSNYGGASIGVSRANCTEGIVEETQERPGEVLWWIVAVLVTILAIRECLQFCISAARYFHSIENIMEMALIIVSGFLLCYGEPPCHLQLKRELASAVLMLSWVELVTMVGRHPMLTSFNTYLTMFYRVLHSFLLFLTWYSLFILAFGLSFYILLHKDNGQEPEENENIFFNHIGLSLVKTFSMFVGELEFSDLPLSSTFSYLFFLVFLFLIVVVLMNLLNGLAVSDTGLIREEAEIHSHVCRVEVISSAEATILGDPGHILTGPSWFFPSFGLRRRLGAFLRIRSVFQKLIGSSRILLFYSCLPDKRLVVHPNKRTIVCSPCLSDKDVSRDIIEAAKNLVVRLSKEQKEKDILHKISARQELLEAKLDSVLVKLENLSNNLRVK